MIFKRLFMLLFIAFMAYFISGCGSSCDNGTILGGQPTPTESPQPQNPRSAVMINVVRCDAVPLKDVAVSAVGVKDVLSGVTDENGNLLLDINAPIGAKFTVTCVKEPFTILPITITIGENGVLQPDGSMFYKFIATAYIPYTSEMTNLSTRASLAYYPTTIYNWNNSLVVSPDGNYFYFVQDEPYCIIRGDISQISKFGSKATTAVTDLPKVTVFAGCPDGSVSGVTDGIGEAASFNNPYNMAISNSGAFLYVGDRYCVRRVDTKTAEVKTIAGNPGESGTVDGIGSEARFYATSVGMAISPDDQYLYLIDGYSIRSIKLSDFTVKTVAGVPSINGNIDGPGESARFASIFGLVITSDGKILYTLDTASQKIRKLVLNSDRVSCTVSTITPDPDSLSVNDLSDLTLSPDDKILYISDTGNDQIRALDLTANTLTDVAGKQDESDHIDGIGENARLGGPQGSDITRDGKYLLFVDYCPHYIKILDLETREVRTLIGGICNGKFREGYVMEAAGPSSFTINSDDSEILFIAPERDYSNYIFGFNLFLNQFVNTEHITTGLSGYEDGPISKAKFNDFTAFTASRDGKTVYAFSDNRLRKLDRKSGTVSTLIGQAGDSAPIITPLNHPGVAVVNGDESELYFFDRNDLKVLDLKAPAIDTIPNCPTPAPSNIPMMAFTPDDAFLYFSANNEDNENAIFKMDTATRAFSEVKLVDVEGNAFAPVGGVCGITFTSDSKRIFFADRYFIYYADLDTLVYRRIAGTDVVPPQSYKLPSGVPGLDVYFGGWISDLKMSSDDAVLYVSDYYNSCIRRLILLP